MEIDQNYLEIFITKKEETFVATTPVFPKAKGKSDTKEGALEKLSQSIGNQIGRTATQSFKSLLLSPRFSNLIIDPNQEQNEHRLYTGSKTPMPESPLEEPKPEKLLLSLPLSLN